MKKSGISLIKMSIYNICIVVFLAILMILGFYLSANGATPVENQEIKAETISSKELEEPIEDKDIENTDIDKPNEAIENQIPSENEDDNIDIQEDVNGYWGKDSQGWHFYNSEGIMQKGFCIINSKQYYFSSDGVMRSGWQNIEGSWYYFGEANDGSAKKDWQYIGGSWYYFEPSYVMVSDAIKEISGSKYAFSASGAMLLGTFKFKDDIYATEPTGEIKDSGWILYNKKWYYKESNGEIIKNTMHNIGGLKYSFDEDGVMRSGWQNIEGSWYYFGEANDGSAKKDWKYIGGHWYYFEPSYVMVSDTIKEIMKSKYAFSASGAMLLGTFKFKDDIYATEPTGEIKDSGWILYNKKWYYKEDNGEIIKDTMHNIGGLKYSFDEDGVMRSGWQNIEGSWYYFGEADDGSAKKDWQYIGGSWYYFEPSYVMVSDTIKEIRKSKYAFSASGAMLLGVFKFKDHIYITDKNGLILNRSEIDEKTMKGIDVSEMNGYIDWKKVADSGIKFAFIRVGGRFSVSGSIYNDSRFSYNISQAKSYGIKVGVYFFTQAINTNEAIEEARFTINKIRSYILDLPIVIDTESVDGGGRHSSISVESRTEVVKAFCEEIIKNGFAPMIYASTSWLDNKLNMSKLSKFKVWVAQWASSVDYKGSYNCWQYTSTGRVNGINGNVDMDIWYN